MASKVTRDHHNLRRNLNLNDNYVSNDGGDEGIRITDAGLVGIGTADPQAELSVYQTGAPPMIEWDAAGNSGARNWGLRASGNAWGDFQLLQGGSLGAVPVTVRLTVSDGGNVGIGVADPDQKLEVKGITKITHHTTVAD